MKNNASKTRPSWLAVFYSKEKANWRFSLITTTFVMGKNKDMKAQVSSPRRYSFLLGEGVKLHTIEQMLGGEAGNTRRVTDYNDLVSRFSVEAVTKEFYNALFKWYDERAIKCVKFPVGAGYDASIKNGGGDTPANREHLIRLITRVMFVWVIKQKWGDLLDWMFDEEAVRGVLRDGTDLHSKEDGTYYNAMLQNLFFATLNRQVVDDDGRYREWETKGGDNKNDDYSVKTKWRDDKAKSFYRISHEEFAERMNRMPFLNGGLFECLDRAQKDADDSGKKARGVEYVDGFSREGARRALVPNALFFGDGRGEAGEGLIDIFSRYNFTVEESTPQDVQVALDPELLGKVFENLLASFNPETQESARKDSGSFYTPREIVGYMVDETLKAVLSDKWLVVSEASPVRHCEGGIAARGNLALQETASLRSKLGSNAKHCDDCHARSDAQVARPHREARNDGLLDALFSDDDTPLDISEEDRMALVRRITQLKILDPACGSGAFPMGVLQRMLSLLQRLDPATDEYTRKRSIIENCIYGEDIQPIAMQIAKLRFFISLVIEQEMTGDAEHNYGIRALPNLETKFVCANTLVGLPQEEKGLLDLNDDKLTSLRAELEEIRKAHYAAQSAKEKTREREKDKKKRQEIIDHLTSGKDCTAEGELGGNEP